MTTETNTDRDRLATVLEPLVSDDPPELARVVAARLWAERCLTDANAALELVEEHGPGDDWRVECEVQYPPEFRFVAVLSKRIDDGIWLNVSEQRAPTLPEALCAAFVTWAESEASSG